MASLCGNWAKIRVPETLEANILPTRSISQMRGDKSSSRFSSFPCKSLIMFTTTWRYVEVTSLKKAVDEPPRPQNTFW